MVAASPRELKAGAGMSSGGRFRVRTVAIAAVFVIAGLAQAAPAVAHGHARAASVRVHRLDPKHKYGRGTSTNWSGYAVDGTNATTVTGSWTVQKATCAAGESSWSSPWVGIDGDNSNTVEQTGTDSDCTRGTPTYYAWYEMYPKKVIQIPITVSPGDSMTGTVTYSATNTFTLTLTDNTTHASYTTTQTSRKAVRTSVEWIVEGPSSGTLSNFGTETFTNDSATINGQSGSLSSFSGATPITMVTAQGTTRATPSSLGKSGSFTDTWQHG
jgi:hypothetical protein